MTITDQKIYGHGWDPLSPDPQLGNPACVKAVSLMAEAKGAAGRKSRTYAFCHSFIMPGYHWATERSYLRKVRTALHQLLPQTEGDRAFY